MCSDEWVGKETCWVRLKVSRRVRKVATSELAGRSTWKLKSPVIMSSDVMVERSSSRVENSSQKKDLEVEGGRYIVRKVKDVVERVRRIHRDSNEEKAGRGTLLTLKLE